MRGRKPFAPPHATPAFIGWAVRRKPRTVPQMTPADRLELDAILREQLRLRNLAAALDQRIAALDRSLAAPAPAEPPPIPKAEPAPAPVAVAAGGEADSFPYSATPTPAPQPAPPAPAPRAETPAESIELKLGTYWLARIGIVILLTGFVFLGNYAYHHIVPHLGAWGKLALLGLAGAALSGAGAWLERGREAMRN